MNFIQVGRTMGDETTPYEVTGYKSKTPAEFVKEILQERPDEWGDIRVKENSVSIFSVPHIDYRRGELLHEIPEEWHNQEIKKVDACGGWGYMAYVITQRN